MINVQEAICRIISTATSLGTETICLEEADGRVLAVDAIACTQNVTAEQFVTTSLARRPSRILPFPSHSTSLEKAAITFAENKLVPAFTSAGSAYKESSLFHSVKSKASATKNTGIEPTLIHKNNPLDTAAITALAAIGQYTIQVEKLPKVAIISTGNEIVPVGSPILPHQIRDSNSYTIKSFLKKNGVLSAATSLVQDDKQRLKEIIHSHLAKDIIIISGGVSKGDADYVPEILQTLGVQELFHGVKMKPGAPLWFGKIPGGGVVFGLPGNPLAVQMACRIFIEPYLYACLGLPPRTPVMLPLAGERIRKSKFDEYFPCKILQHAHFSGLLPIKHNGSGDICSTINSDGIALQTENRSYLSAQTHVPFYYW